MLGRAVDPRFVDTALGAVGLASQANMRARGFSAGMQRRLALARLRMLDPRLVLLDEPYSSLDPEGAELVSSLIADVRQHDGAAIVVTHDVARAVKVADRIVALVDGRIVPWTADHVTRADIVDEPSPVGSERS
jgi:heme exporter protein A